MAGSLNAQGRFDEGDVIFRRLAVKARTDSERVDAARGRATSLGGAGRLAEAESMLTQLRAQIDEEALRRRLDMMLCVVASQSGRLADAIRASGRSSQTNGLISTVAWKRPRGWRVCWR